VRYWCRGVGDSQLLLKYSRCFHISHTTTTLDVWTQILWAMISREYLRILVLFCTASGVLYIHKIDFQRKLFVSHILLHFLHSLFHPHLLEVSRNSYSMNPFFLFRPLTQLSLSSANLRYAHTSVRFLTIIV